MKTDIYSHKESFMRAINLIYLTIYFSHSRKAIETQNDEEAPMNQPGSGLPQISLKERDRRYALIRRELKNSNVDCAVVTGTNLFYITNGIPG